MEAHEIPPPPEPPSTPSRWSQPVRPTSFVLFGGCVYACIAVVLGSFNERRGSHPLDEVVNVLGIVVAFIGGAVTAAIIAVIAILIGRRRSGPGLTQRAALFLVVPPLLLLLMGRLSLI